MLTQWAYVYSRLPYLLVYMHSIVEHVCATIAPTSGAYLHDIDRRISALVLLWSENVKSPYDEEHLDRFVCVTQARLFERCQQAGYRLPTLSDLAKMAHTGAYPGESESSVAERNLQFHRDAAASNSVPSTDAGGPLRNWIETVRSWILLKTSGKSQSGWPCSKTSIGYQNFSSRISSTPTVGCIVSIHMR